MRFQICHSVTFLAENQASSHERKVWRVTCDPGLNLLTPDLEGDRTRLAKFLTWPDNFDWKIL